MYTLAAWQDIADRYTDTLVLGNGASIALDSCFSYKSLFESAKAETLITDDVAAVFSYFDTTDFEHVMRMLWHAWNVNLALNITDDRTRTVYNDLRAALIRTVRKTHAEYSVVQTHLEPIEKWMARFSQVFSLNYDLTVYWAMLSGNERRGGNWFKDCWVGGEFEGDWDYLTKPHRVDGVTLVFFPHGSLLFATDPEVGEIKISSKESADSLLERIVMRWANEDAIPMFVSEGESRQKSAAIARHGYLSAVYNDALTQVGPSVVVYGWGMSDNDEHIVKRIAARRVARIAVSVLRGAMDQAALDRHCTKLVWKIRQENTVAAVEFFDATSAGCWNIS